MRKSLWVAVVSLWAALAHAQSTTSTIQGQVRAETQAALPGVEITARHVESGLVRTAVTDARGHFTLAALPVGTYEVRATLERFRPLVRPGIPLAVGEPVVLSLTLVLGGAEDEVTVTRGDRGAAHALRRARLPRLRADDPRPAPERAQLHRPRVPAARRRRLPLSRGWLGGGPRPRGERQRPGPALERVPARRHAHERLHEQPGRERGGHDARHGDRARVPRGGERLRRRVRAQPGRADQRDHEVRHQRLPRLRLRVPPERRPRRAELLRPGAEARLPAQPVRVHARRPRAPRPHVLLRGLRGAAGAARPNDLDRRARRGGPQRRPARPRAEAPSSCR